MSERITRDFTFAGVRFNIVTLPSKNKLQVWFKSQVDSHFQFGHSKPLPKGMTADKAADTVREFLMGQLDAAEYNRLLPSEA
ncbi:hypothetical protein M045_gp72 [Mycobacterium phage HINdeR]|uniref:Uncharacterized protein n=1 Tax=Mycobacterium phage HINdeR TaxID=1327770 RepID=R4JP44_9CAUD|nr:hypothetical protein M045_gp72 [Mycobacterium phage HINdeR]AGK87551.1 hypothetical protein PBI_HINDER_72 [Mycobacterium phage HINdeR]